MNIGFTGTRRGLSEAQWHWLKRIIRERIFRGSPCDSHTFHHGCCVGADAQAHGIVRDITKDGFIRIAKIGHPPLDTRHKSTIRDYEDLRPPAPYLDRNHDIVDECDLLIACPHGPEEMRGSGTWATVRYARKQLRPIVFIWPDGSVTEES